MRPRVKICCIQDEAEAALAIEAGADALGFVAAMPSGPGPIADDVIARIVPGVPPPVATVLLTSRTDAAGIEAHLRSSGANTVQIVERVAPEVHAGLRTVLPQLRLIQVVHVEGPAAIAEARAIAPHVDAILLDSGRPNAPVRVLGGTGSMHDWRISREIVRSCGRPVFLAGGLRADNVGRAIREVRPFGLDLCTGVRTDYRLDAVKLRAFFHAVRAACEEFEDDL